MPLFVKNKIVFIHIPKTAGSSIEQIYRDLEDDILFFSSTDFINGHSPQHSTYLELKKWNMIPSDFRIISVIRNPYERFISEFNYQKGHLGRDYLNLELFTKSFFNPDNRYDWDNHQLSCSEFLRSSNAEIIRFENLHEDFERLTGLKMNQHILKSKTELKFEDLDAKYKRIIEEFWKEDFSSYY